MARAGWECRVQHAFNLRPHAQPTRDIQGGSLDLLESHGERLHSAQSQTAIVRGRGAAQQLLSCTQTFVYLSVLRRYRSEQKVAVTADIFGKRLHGYVDAVRQRIEIHACRPGVIHYDQSPSSVDCLCDGWHVLYLHADRAGTLAPDDSRVGLNQAGNTCAEGRVVVANLHAETPQNIVAELSIGSVDALGKKHVIAGAKQGKVDQRNSILAAGSDDGAIATFQLADTRGEFQGGRSAVEAVGVADFVLIPGVSDRCGISE